MSLLKITNASTGYGNKQVLFKVSLDVEKGDKVLLIGTNGSGKSTLLKLVYGLIDVWEGTVEYDGKILHSPLKKTPTHELIDMGIQYVPQKDALFEDFTVEENLRSSLLHLKSRRDIEERLKSVIKEMPWLGTFSKSLACQLSGGERKLLSVAMALVNRPNLLLLDEPLSGISEDKVPMIVRQLRRISADGTTVVVVEHRINEILDYVDTVQGLRFGRVYSGQLGYFEEMINFMSNEN